MAIVINGNGTVTGLAVGGLPDGTVDAGTLAANSVDSAELIDGAVDNSHMAAMAATKLTGTIATARLGSGTAGTGNFLRGDGSWQTAAAAPTAGDVVQVVTFSSTGGGNQDGAYAYQATHLVSAITPQYSNSKIIVAALCQVYMNNTSGEAYFGLNFKRAISGGATTANINSETSNSSAQHRSIGNGELTGIWAYSTIDAPSTTSATTYTLIINGSGSANTIWGWQGMPDTLILTEIKV